MTGAEIDPGLPVPAQAGETKRGRGGNNKAIITSSKAEQVAKMQEHDGGRKHRVHSESRTDSSGSAGLIPTRREVSANAAAKEPKGLQ